MLRGRRIAWIVAGTLFGSSLAGLAITLTLPEPPLVTLSRVGLSLGLAAGLVRGAPLARLGTIALCPLEVVYSLVLLARGPSPLMFATVIALNAIYLAAAVALIASPSVKAFIRSRGIAE